MCLLSKGGLQHEVAKVLAARVQHAGPSEARIAEWASRRFLPFDAVADAASQIRAASTDHSTAATTVSGHSTSMPSHTFEVSVSGSERPPYEAQAGSSRALLAPTGSRSDTIAGSDSIMEGLEAGMKFCSGAQGP